MMTTPTTRLEAQMQEMARTLTRTETRLVLLAKALGHGDTAEVTEELL